MIVLYSYRWIGSVDDHNEFYDRVKAIFDEIDGATLRGPYMPNTEFTGTWIMETDTFEKVLAGYNTYQDKYGPNPSVTVQKYDILVGPPL